MTEKEFIDSCRRELRNAGYALSEGRTGGGVGFVRAEKGDEVIVLGHPAGLATTYMKVCQVAKVPLPTEGGGAAVPGGGFAISRADVAAPGQPLPCTMREAIRRKVGGGS